MTYMDDYTLGGRIDLVAMGVERIINEDSPPSARITLEQLKV